MQPMQLIQCRDTAGFTVQGGARQGCTVPTQPRVHLSVRACPPRAAPGQAGGAVSGVWGLRVERHTCGGGGEDPGQEARRLYTSICMPYLLPGSGASGPPSAPQLTSLAGWFPSRHRAEVGAEHRGEKGGCSHPHEPSHVGRLGSLRGSCPSPELWAAHRAQRGLWVEDGVDSYGVLGCCCAPGFPWAM